MFRNLRIPGIQSIQIEVLEYIFEACLNPISELDDDQAIATANIETLADLVMTFGSPMDQKAVHKGALGAWNPVKDEHAKNFPLTGSHGVEVQSPSRRFGRTGARQQESNQTTEMATSIPLKFISHKSKTSLVAPTGFDRESSVKFSAMKPEYECNRYDHYDIINLNGNLFLLVITFCIENFCMGCHRPFNLALRFKFFQVLCHPIALPIFQSHQAVGVHR